MKTIPKGTVIRIKCDTGYCGMDSEEYYKLASDYTEDELDRIAWQEGLNNAEMYGIYPDSEEDDDYDSPYSGSNIDGYWEVVSEEDLKDLNKEYITEM